MVKTLVLKFLAILAAFSLQAHCQNECGRLWVSHTGKIVYFTQSAGNQEYGARIVGVDTDDLSKVVQVTQPLYRLYYLAWNRRIHTLSVLEAENSTLSNQTTIVVFDDHDLSVIKFRDTISNFRLVSGIGKAGDKGQNLLMSGWKTDPNGEVEDAPVWVIYDEYGNRTVAENPYCALQPPMKYVLCTRPVCQDAYEQNGLIVCAAQVPRLGFYAVHPTNDSRFVQNCSNCVMNFALDVKSDLLALPVSGPTLQHEKMLLLGYAHQLAQIKDFVESDNCRIQYAVYEFPIDVRITDSQLITLILRVDAKPQQEKDYSFEISVINKQELIEEVRNRTKTPGTKCVIRESQVRDKKLYIEVVNKSFILPVPPVLVALNEHSLTYIFEEFYIQWIFSDPQAEFVLLPHKVNDAKTTDDQQSAYLCTVKGVEKMSLGARSTKPASSLPMKYLIMIIILTVLLFVFLISFVFYVVHSRRQRLKLMRNGGGSAENAHQALIEPLNGYSANQISSQVMATDDSQSVSEQQLYGNDDDEQPVEITLEQFKKKYSLVRQIGRGGFSSVYRYQEIKTGVQVAVKIMTSVDRQDFDRKRQEIAIMEKLRAYKNIVQINNYVFHDHSDEAADTRDAQDSTGTAPALPAERERSHASLIYVVMELADCTLSQLLRVHAQDNTFVPNSKLLRWTYQLIDTLAQLQEKENIVHRDIKPSNILLFRSATRAKISDFGCSKVYSLQDFSDTRTMIGTQNYLSPQARHTYNVMSGIVEGDILEWDVYKNDVFALGLTLLAAATVHNVSPMWNVKQDVLNKEIAYLQSLGRYSEVLIYCIKKLLTWDEHRRPSFAIIKQYLDQELEHDRKISMKTPRMSKAHQYQQYQQPNVVTTGNHQFSIN